MQHRILGTVYTLLNENKKNIKKICAPSFQTLEDRQNRGSISERESKSNADPVKCLAYYPSFRYSQRYPRSSYWIERQRLDFFGEKCFKVFKFAKLEHQKREEGREWTHTQFMHFGNLWKGPWVWSWVLYCGSQHIQWVCEKKKSQLQST